MLPETETFKYILEALITFLKTMQSLVGEIFVTKFFHNLSTGTKTFKQRVDVKRNKPTKSSLMETFLEIRLISRKISMLRL